MPVPSTVDGVWYTSMQKHLLPVQEGLLCPGPADGLFTYIICVYIYILMYVIYLYVYIYIYSFLKECLAYCKNQTACSIKRMGCGDCWFSLITRDLLCQMGMSYTSTQGSPYTSVPHIGFLLYQI